MSEEVSSNLLGGIVKEAAPIPAANPVDLPVQHTDAWAWDDGLPGSGPRPTWLKDKYTNIAAQAKAYLEAEKQLGQLSSTPENYDFGDYAELLDTNNPHIQQFMETAKKSRLPQESFKEILGSLVEYQKSQAPNLDEEIAKLGVGAHEKIETVKRWASNNLSQEACDTLGAISTSAKVINLVDELRQLQMATISKPPGATSAMENYTIITREDIDAELAVPANANRYVTDSKYRQEINNKLKIIYGED